MKIRYIYSACVVIQTEGYKFLCDPWIGVSAFEGAWGQYPKIDNPISAIGKVDYIYISHAHDDHFDPRFLRKYLKEYPDAKVFIGETIPPILSKNLDHWDIPYTVIDKPVVLGDATVAVIPNQGYDEFNLDTSLVVKTRDACVVNLNDNPFDEEQIKKIKSICGDKIDIALLPYTGAGPYPSMYEFDDDNSRLQATRQHNLHWLHYFEMYRDALRPEKILPFAGKYYLTGEFAKRNRLKGNIDPLDLKMNFPEVIVLSDGGYAEYCTNTKTASSERYEHYDLDKISSQMTKENHKYKEEIDLDFEGRNPLKKLLEISLFNANKRLPLTDNYEIVFRFTNEKISKCLVGDTANAQVKWISEQQLPKKRFEINIDANLLFGVLTNVYIWQSVDYLATFKRIPNVYDERFLTYLHFLHV